MIKFIDYPDRKTWLENRYKTLGASEIGIACGISRFKSISDLWEEKTGRRQAEDITENERVHYGTEAEKYLRALFALKHEKGYRVEYFPYRVYFNEEEPYLTATLDGLITRLMDGAKGGYECKTVLVQSKRTLEEWDNRIPETYYCQILQQMYAAGLDFVMLNAELRFPDNNADIREYLVERSNVENDIKWVVRKGQDFKRYVLTDKRPPITMTL